MRLAVLALFLLWLPGAALGAMGDRTLVDSEVVSSPVAEVVLDLPAGCLEHEIKIIGFQGSVQDDNIQIRLREATTGQWRQSNENAHATWYLGSNGETIKESHQSRHSMFITSRGIWSATQGGPFGPAKPEATVNSEVRIYHASRADRWTNLFWSTTYQTVIAVHGMTVGGGSVKLAEAHDAIRFAPGAGQVVGGTFLAYCVADGEPLPEPEPDPTPECSCD